MAAVKAPTKLRGMADVTQSRHHAQSGKTSWSTSTGSSCNPCVDGLKDGEMVMDFMPSLDPVYCCAEPPLIPRMEGVEIVPNPDYLTTMQQPSSPKKEPPAVCLMVEGGEDMIVPMWNHTSSAPVPGSKETFSFCMGVYDKVDASPSGLDWAYHEKRSVYKNGDDRYLFFHQTDKDPFFAFGRWMISIPHGRQEFYLVSAEGDNYMCPTKVSQWMVYDETEEDRCLKLEPAITLKRIEPSEADAMPRIHHDAPEDPDHIHHMEEKEVLDLAWWCYWCICGGCGTTKHKAKCHLLTKCLCCRQSCEHADAASDDLYEHEGICSIKNICCCCAAICQYPPKEDTPRLICCNLHCLGHFKKSTAAQRKKNDAAHAPKHHVEIPISYFDFVIHDKFMAWYCGGCGLALSAVPLDVLDCFNKCRCCRCFCTTSPPWAEDGCLMYLFSVRQWHALCRLPVKMEGNPLCACNGWRCRKRTTGARGLGGGIKAPKQQEMC